MKNNLFFGVKKIHLSIVLIFMFFFTVSCANDNEISVENEHIENGGQVIEKVEKIPSKGNDSPNAVKNMGKLVTLKCSYHNVAVSNKSAGSGLAHIGEKERKFWLKYTTDITISYDMQKLDIKSNNNAITLKLPKPDIKPENFEFDDNYYVADKDNKLSKNPITVDDIQKAIGNAQLQLEGEIEQDDTLISQADNQAKKIIESYIDEIGKNVGIEYDITWED